MKYYQLIQIAGLIAGGMTVSMSPRYYHRLDVNTFTVIDEIRAITYLGCFDVDLTGECEAYSSVYDRSQLHGLWKS